MENLNSKDLEKFLTQATLADVKMVVLQAVREATMLAMAENEEKRHYVYGLAGLANLFGCSIATAERIKQSGVLDEAISQHKGIIIVDAEMALNLLRASGKHHTLSNRINPKTNCHGKKRA